MVQSVRGSKILLDDLDEGVVVLDQDIRRVHYTNKIAKNLNVYQDKTFYMVLKQVNGENKELTIDAPMFAPICKSLFKPDMPDATTIINKIETMKEYMSLE